MLGRLQTHLIVSAIPIPNRTMIKQQGDEEYPVPDPHPLLIWFVNKGQLCSNRIYWLAADTANKWPREQKIYRRMQCLCSSMCVILHQVPNLERIRLLRIRQFPPVTSAYRRLYHPGRPRYRCLTTSCTVATTTTSALCMAAITARSELSPNDLLQEHAKACIGNITATHAIHK